MPIETTKGNRPLEVSIFLPTAVSDINSLSSFENGLGVKFHSCKWYEDWSDDFYPTIANAFANHGCLPELTWQPQQNGSGVAYDDVLTGKYDAYLDKFALAVKSFGRPLRISLAPEMNSEWVPWGINKNGNNNENHREFFRYVVHRFRSNGVSNVKWIWAANIRYYGDAYSYRDMYPGDDVVDFAGLDGYNWGTSQSWSVWQSFSEVFGQSYNELTGITDRPILIMETASTEAGGDKAAWIYDMFTQLDRSFSQIAGFTWFSINKETDWRIDSSAAAKEAFSRAANGQTPISTSPATPTDSTITDSTPTSIGSLNKKGSGDFQVESSSPPASDAPPTVKKEKISLKDKVTVTAGSTKNKKPAKKSNNQSFQSKTVPDILPPADAVGQVRGVDYMVNLKLASKVFVGINLLFLLMIIVLAVRLHPRSSFDF